MVNLLLSVTFACGVLIAMAHVVNTKFIAPVYDVVLNLVAFCSSVVASALLRHTVPALLSALAVLCWIVLARRTWLAQCDNKSRNEPSLAATVVESGAST